MKKLSLKIKLLATSLTTILLLLFALTWTSYSSIVNLSEHLTSTAEQTITKTSIQLLTAEASSLGDKVSNYLGASFSTTLTLAEITQANLRDSLAVNQQQMTREQLDTALYSTLLANPNISSAYIHFINNGYDNLDFFYKNSDHLHSTEQEGTFESYWVRDGNRIFQQRVEDPNEKYLSDLDEYGVRESEWFLCAQDTKKPCIVEPYYYEVNEGYGEIMMGLTAPINYVEGNKVEFRGIAGVDLNLPEFQSLAEELSRHLYDGAAQVTILSKEGRLVASSQFKNQLMQPLSQVIPTRGQELSQLHQRGGYLETDETIYVAEEIKLPLGNASWSIIIEAPKSVILSSVTKMLAEADAQKTSTITTQLLLGLGLGALALIVISLVIASIIRPLIYLNNQVKQLASSDGDLTQTINIKTHAELIELGRNFNLFIDKLRSMIVALRDVSKEVRTESQTNLDISRQTRASIDTQQNEINSIVTATQELSSTAQEVANIAVNVSEQTEDIQNKVQASQTNLSQAANISLALSDNMNSASESINKVEASSEAINGILEVIGNIAEQTNLLALNASIEAARAGEHGRGFAVVADEVRNLASQTQASTEEINSMISSLQSEVNQAVDIIELGREQATTAQENTRLANESLNEVVEAINLITDSVYQVANAAGEQSSVSEEVAQNLNLMGDAAEQLAELAQLATSSSRKTSRQLDSLDKQLAELST